MFSPYGITNQAIPAWKISGLLAAALDNRAAEKFRQPKLLTLFFTQVLDNLYVL
jgi:hypothetical protein